MALSAPRNTPSRNLNMRDVALYQAVKVYQGAIVCINTSHGYGVPGSTATTLLAVGVAQKTVDNTTGSSGAVTVPVKSGECYRFANSSSGDLIAVANRGAVCYIVDDQTVALTNGGSTRSIAGIIEDVDSSGVWVRIGYPLDSAAVTASNAVDTLTTDLASTANAKGASKIGIEDSGSKITATTVEGALAEAIDGRRIATTAADATLAGAYVTHLIAVPATASSTKSITLNATYGKLRVLDVHFIKAGTTGSTTDAVKLTDGTNDITDSLALNTKAAGAIVRATSISQTYGTLAGGATLVANYTKDAGGTAEGTLVITGVRSA